MPFDVENVVKYNANYLRGFTSEKRDTSIDDLKELVDTQGKDIARFAANDTLKTYDRGVKWNSEELKILACGYDNGAVTLINMKSLSSEGTLSDHKKITVCKFLEDYPTLIVCDQEGDIHFWTIALTKPKKIMKDYMKF